MNPLLQITELTQSYNTVSTAVQNLSLEVYPGEIFGFIGHNGAGKSTTIKSIVGILSVDKGEIMIDGLSVKDKRKECQQICAYVPDNPDLYGYMSGIDYINFIADLFQVTSERRNELIKHYCDAFEITPYLGNLIASYSHGMKQKIALIAAMVHEPKLLVLDEPFVGLDPKAINVLKNCMRDLCDRGSAVFYSTHVLDVAEKICDRVGMIDHGEIVVCGKTADLIKDMSLEELFLTELQKKEASRHE